MTLVERAAAEEEEAREEEEPAGDSTALCECRAPFTPTMYMTKEQRMH